MIVNQVVQHKFNIYNPSKIENFSNKPSKLERTPHNDCISFKSSTPRALSNIFDNPNTHKGIELGQKLIEEIKKTKTYDLEAIKRIINQESPHISVKPIEDIAKIIPDPQNYKAFLTSDLDKDFNRVNESIYLNTPKNSSEIFDYVSDFSHEATHVVQNMHENHDINLLKRASNSDRNVAETLRGIFNSTFKTFDVNAKHYLPIINDKEGPNIINLHLREIVKKFVEQISDDKDPTHMQNLLRSYTNPLDLISDTKKYCAIKSRNEIEAYATEFAMAHQFNPPLTGAFTQVINFFAQLESIFKTH